MKKVIGTLLILIGMSVGAAQAFELGQVTIASKSGEPLVIRIPIFNLYIDGYSTLAGSIEGYHEAIDDLSYTVKRYGKDYIFIMKSASPLYEPFEAKVVLTYRKETAERLMLIDPTVGSNKVVKPTSMKLFSNGGTVVNQPIVTQGETAPYVYDTNLSTPTIKVGENEYLVRRGDSVSAIAQKLKRELGGTMHQRVVAIYRINMAKFVDRNINVLPVHTVLVLPPKGDIELLARGEAKKKFYQLLAGNDVSLEGIYRREKTTAEISELVAESSEQLNDIKEQNNKIIESKTALLADVRSVSKQVEAGENSDELKERVSALETKVDELTAQTKRLADKLGELLAQIGKTTQEFFARND